MKKQAKYEMKRYFEFIVGVLLVAIAFNLFLLPANIVSGGVSGVSIVITSFVNIDPATFILVVSVFLLLLSFILLGKEKTINSIIGSLLFPVFIKLTENIGTLINLNTDNMLVTAIFGGVLFGAGAGLTLKAGFTSGGTDIVNQILSKYLKISLGNATLITDGLIVLAGGFVFGWVKFMYAVVVLTIVSTIIDKIIIGISNCKAFYIITDKKEEIADFVFNELGHTVTLFDAKGGYSNKKHPVLFTVIPTKEYFKFKAGIHQIDDKAFFVVADAYEVKGGE